MFPLSTECCVKAADPQCVGVVAFRKTVSVQDNRLETDVYSASSGADVLDLHGVFRGP